MMLHYVLLFAFAAAACAQTTGTFYCASITAHLDCNTYPKEELCGTDGITYNNNCSFSKAHCKDSSLHMAHLGVCSGKKPLSKKGWIIALGLFCKELSQMTCPHLPDPVCGSDGVTYDTVCEFTKTLCMHHKLTIASNGRCP